jgi:hypothetical protein
LSGEHLPSAALIDHYLRLISLLGLMAELPEELRAHLADR